MVVFIKEFMNKGEVFMSSILETILTRRSIRSFSDKQISKEDLQTIVQAGIYAPSGKNQQSWKFTVIQKPEVIEKLAGAVKQALQAEHYDFYCPNALILLSNDRNNSNGLADCACALENIFLMAKELEIGSCWINQLKDTSDNPEVRTLLTDFEIPSSHIVWGVAALGYAKEQPQPKPRKEGTVHYIL